MWFVTALIGVAAVILISQLINENRILQYFGRISLIILCIHGPVYRIVVKIVSILLHVGTDAVRENFLLSMVVVAITMEICSTAYAREKFEECILIFSSNEEKENFKEYAVTKWAERQNYLEDVRLPHMELPSGYREDAFKEEYENAIVLKKMLDEYRSY